MSTEEPNWLWQAGYDAAKNGRDEIIRDLETRVGVLELALAKIARYDEQSIWMDDRDDAANAMLDIAREAVPNYETFTIPEEE